jgi:hypothetical protein
MGLRTSTLACPVSSLLSDTSNCLFANQYPVLDQRINNDDSFAQVILGADDKHLNFRSCVGVTLKDNQEAVITLGNRVHCKNWFGKFYMRAIHTVHHQYIAPTMLKRAADYVITRMSWQDIP